METNADGTPELEYSIIMIAIVYKFLYNNCIYVAYHIRASHNMEYVTGWLDDHLVKQYWFELTPNTN